MSTFILDGKLVTCGRTFEGIEAVANGSVELDARQRQFWLVVDKTDSMNQSITEKLAEKINIHALIEAGLLYIESKCEKTLPASKVVVDTSNPESVITTSQFDDDAKHITMAAALYDNAYQAPERPEEAMELVKVEKKAVDVSEIDALPYDARLDWAKQTMCMSVKLTSGLLAADLIRGIERSNNVNQLKRFTARWRTTMLDSRYDKKAIDVWLEQVKYALDTLSSHTQTSSQPT